MTTDKVEKRQDVVWWAILIGVPVVSLALTSLPPQLRDRLFQANFSRENPFELTYRYPFAESLTNQENPKRLVQNEIAFYHQRVSQEPQGGLNLAALAHAYLKMARTTGEGHYYLLAEQTAWRSLSSLPFNNEGALLVLAKVAEARHDFASALNLAAKVGWNHEDALAINVSANLAMGNLNEANQAAETLVQRIPSLNTLTLRALVRVAQGKDNAAIQDFQQALAVEEASEIGSSAKTRALFGRFYAQRGEWERAAALYREALRLVPRYSFALVHLAQLEMRRGNYSQAEKLYSQVIADSKAASTVFDHVVDQSMARLKKLQGDAKAAQEWQEKAEKLLRQQTATGHGSGSFGHRRELATLLLERGRSPDVAEALTLMKAEVKVRRDAHTLDTLAWALLSSGDAVAAQTVMDEALDSGIRDPGIFYRAGVIAKAVGNEQQSQTYLQLAYETDPTFDEQARRGLGLGLDISY